MSWPIPKIPAKAVIPQPNNKRWVILLLTMALAGGGGAIFPGGATSYGQALLYGALPAVLLWLCAFGIVFYRYEQSVNAALLWNEETERTKQHWQHWSRKQKIVVGNVTLTPEEKGIDILLGNPADIPAYPEKARPFYTDLSGLSERLKFIDQEIEKQYPGYRNHLGEIVIQYHDKYYKEIIGPTVYHQWALYPEYSNAAESFCADGENERSELKLLLCLQDWAGYQAGEFSEFITAQLIAADHFVSQNRLPVIAGVGRWLSSACLNSALDMLSEYNRLEKEPLRYIWVSGLNADDQSLLIQYIISKQWPLFERRPLISLNHSFGPSGPLMFSIAISLLTDAAKYTGETQLLISRDEGNMYSLCLITRELFV